jgi:hypothetical protein
MREDEQPVLRRCRPFPHDRFVFAIEYETNGRAISFCAVSQRVLVRTRNLPFQIRCEAPPSVSRTRKRLGLDTGPQSSRTTARFGYRTLVSQPDGYVRGTAFPLKRG